MSVTPAAPDTRFIVDGDDERLVRADRMAYVLDGSVYITPVAMLRETGRFWDEDSEIFINRYPRFYDIDTEDDLVAAAALLSG